MKIRFIAILCIALFGWGGVIHAATWINSGSGSYQDASNWDNGVVPGMGEAVTISGNVTVTDGQKRDWWEQTVTVSNGAILNCTSSVTKWQNGTITVQNGGRIVIDRNGDMVINNSGNLVINCFSKDGIHINEHIQVTSSGVASSSLNFGLEGSMFINEIWSGDWSVAMAFSLDTGLASGASAIYSIETRTLVDLDHNTGGGITNMVVSSSTVKNLADQSLTAVSSLADLTLDASGLGKYYLYRDDANGGDWVCKYVKASPSVPEPSVVLMGMFGMAGSLLLRRRQ